MMIIIIILSLIIIIIIQKLKTIQYITTPTSLRSKQQIQKNNSFVTMNNATKNIIVWFALRKIFCLEE